MNTRDIKTAAQRDALVAVLLAMPFRESVEEETLRWVGEFGVTAGALGAAIEGGVSGVHYKALVKRAIRHRRACDWETDKSKAVDGVDYFVLWVNSDGSLDKVSGEMLRDDACPCSFARADDVLANVPGVQGE